MKQFTVVIFCCLGFSFQVLTQEVGSSSDENRGENLKSKVKGFYKVARKNIESDLLISEKWCQRGIDLAEAMSFNDLVVEGYIVKSEIQYKSSDYVKALNSSLIAMNSSAELSDSLKISLYKNLGDVLLNLKAYELTISYRKKLLETSSFIDFDNYYLFENIAFCYGKLKNKDSCLFYYGKALDIANELSDTSLMLHCYNNKGYFFESVGDFELASKFYNSGLSLFEVYESKTHGDSVIKAMLLSNYSDIYISDGAFQKALTQVYKANQLLNSSDSMLMVSNFIRAAKIHNHLKYLDSSEYFIDLTSRYIDDQGLLEFARVKIDKAILAQDISGERMARKDYEKLLLKEIEKSKLNETFIEILNSQNEQVKVGLEKEKGLLEKESELNRFRYKLWIVGLLFLIFVIVIGFWFRRRKNNQLKQLEIENQKIQSQRLKEKLDSRKKDLTEFGIEITRKHEFLNELLGDLNSDNEFVKSDYRKKIEGHLRVDQTFNIFHENIEKINHEFLDRLSKEFPLLTNNDLQVCAMIRLGMNAKEIAQLKNISSESVKKIRYRLRKKMSLAESHNLTDFLKDFKA